MRCKNCKKCNTVSTKARCWKEWQLCGSCAVVKHPSKFPKQFVHVQGKQYKIMRWKNKENIIGEYR